MGALPGVSIIVPNYNYERFVGAAIESALAQDHPDCEVIVVDDRSTDGSRAVIERYAGRVRTVFLPENGGQVAAVYAAWPLARHPILIFLDSDDLLVPHAASAVARAWAPGVVKVQFPLASIDAEGRPLGHVAPKYPPNLDTEKILQELLLTGACPASQGSGNAYARSLMERVPLFTKIPAPDSLLEVNAPFYGEVLTLHEPLVYYRMHDANDSRQNELTPERFLKYIRGYDDKLAYFRDRCAARGLDFDPEAARWRSAWYIECQMAAAKLSPPSTARRVSPLRVLGRAMRAMPRLPKSSKHRAVLLAWLTAVAVMPRRLAEGLIAFRFIVGRRPRWLERVARLVTS